MFLWEKTLVTPARHKDLRGCHIEVKGTERSFGGTQVDFEVPKRAKRLWVGSREKPRIWLILCKQYLREDFKINVNFEIDL